MKKHLFSFLLILIFAFSVAAQQNVDKQVEKIRKIYTEISQIIEESDKDKDAEHPSGFAVNELVINKSNLSWAAVGNYRVVYKFYYQNRDEEPYPTQLVKVTKSTESAARRYYEEFVYDEADQLIFYFERSEDDEVPLERRIYFEKEKAIRIIEDKATRDKLTNNDRSTVRNCLKQSGKVEQIFINSID
jgi:hypothetical protein